MLIYLILYIILPVICIVHLVKKSRNFLWVYLIIFLPLIGCIAYFIVEILPELLNRTRRSSVSPQNIMNAINPALKLKQLEEQLEFSETFQNKQLLADACLEAGELEKAIHWYQECLKGVHANDIDTLGKLALTFFVMKKYSEAREQLEKLKEEQQGRIKKYEHHLLYAEILEKLELNEDAEKEYEQLTNLHGRYEALYKYGMFYLKTGKINQAKGLFENLIKMANNAPTSYVENEREWIALSRRELDKLAKEA